MSLLSKKKKHKSSLKGKIAAAIILPAIAAGFSKLADQSLHDAVKKAKEQYLKKS